MEIFTWLLELQILSSSSGQVVMGAHVHAHVTMSGVGDTPTRFSFCWVVMTGGKLPDACCYSFYFVLSVCSCYCESVCCCCL